MNDHEQKLAFDTKQQALAAALQLKHLHGTEVTPYQCSKCQLWHLTTK